MSFLGRRRGVTLALLTATAVGIGSLAIASPSQAEPKNPLLAVSSKSDRSNPSPLEGASLEGTKWIYVGKPADTSKAIFFIDQPDFAEIHHVEHVKPFDLMGTKADGNAAGLDTALLGNGSHTISVVLLGKGQSTKVLNATFSVDNSGTDAPAPPNSSPTTTIPVSNPPASNPPTTTPPNVTPTTKPPSNIPPRPLPVPQPRSSDEVSLNVTLNGKSEVPGPGDVDGTASFVGILDTKFGSICYDVEVAKVGTPTDFHIHRGSSTEAGPVVVTLKTPADADRETCIGMPIDVAKRIAANPANYYLNLHTTDFPKGAIRGQLNA